MSSVSQILRQTREAKGVALEEVAQRTYIKLPYLLALEEGDIEKLPAPVYIHGYIRQYAKLLGLNGSELVLQYQQDAGRATQPAAKLALSPASRIASLLAERGSEPERPALSAPDVRDSFSAHPAEPVAETPRLSEPALLERMVPAAEPAVRETVAAPEPTVREVSPEPSVRQVGAEPSLRKLAPEPVAAPLAPEPVAIAAPLAPEPIAAPLAPEAAAGTLAPWEVQQAKQQAHQILASAQREAQEMRVAAERYADQVLAQLESEVHRSLQTVRNGRAYLQSRRRKLQES